MLEWWGGGVVGWWGGGVVGWSDGRMVRWQGCGVVVGLWGCGVAGWVSDGSRGGVNVYMVYVTHQQADLGGFSDKVLNIVIELQ